MLMHRIPAAASHAPSGPAVSVPIPSGPSRRAAVAPAPPQGFCSRFAAVIASPSHRRLVVSVGICVLLACVVGYRGFFGPPSWHVDDLDPSDALNLEAMQIGVVLRRRAEAPPWKDKGWLYPRLTGVLLLVRGDGRVDPVRYMPFAGSYWRFRKQITYAVLAALEDASRRGAVPAGTIVHYGLEDSDVYFHEAEEGRGSTRAGCQRGATV